MLSKTEQTLRVKRYVPEDHHSTFSCVAATGKRGLFRGTLEGETKNAKADGWSIEEEINSEESTIRLGRDDIQKQG